MKQTFANIGKQIVDMAKANGVGRASAYEFDWRGVEFKVLVTTRRDAKNHVPTPVSPHQPDTIDRIKAYRNEHDCGLKEAVDAIRAIDSEGERDE